MLNLWSRKVYFLIDKKWGDILVDKKEIGKRLRHLRGNRRREDVALAIGVSVSALSMYENGERVPRDEIKIAIANFYGETIEAIFFGN